MKKIIILIALLFLAGCTSNGPIDTVGYSVVNENNKTFIALNESHFYTIRAADILAMDEEGTIFMSPIEWMLRGLQIDISRTSNDIGLSMYSLDNISNRGASFASDERGNFYIPLTISDGTNKEQKIVRFNSSGRIRQHDELQGTIIREWGDSLYLNFFASGDNLIIFEPRLENDRFIYTITRVNMEQNDETVIVEKTFCLLEHYGYVIANIFVRDDAIFLYRIKINNNNETFFVDELDFYGNRINYQQFDLDDFLYMAEVSDDDSIVRLFVFCNHLVFSTLHNRIAIYRFTDEGFAVINVPAEFQRLGALTIMNGFSPHDAYIYFWSFDTHTLHIFDTTNESFHSVEIYFHFSDGNTRFLESRIHQTHRDPAGNILFQVRVDMEEYFEHIRQEEKRLNNLGEVFVSGDIFPPNTSQFFRLGVDKIVESALK